MCDARAGAVPTTHPHSRSLHFCRNKFRSVAKPDTSLLEKAQRRIAGHVCVGRCRGVLRRIGADGRRPR